MSQVENHIFTLDDLDDESMDDFMSSLYEALEIIEKDLGNLEKNPFDSDAVNSLFRSMHSIKGNCRMCFMEPLSDYAHELEEVISEVREGRLAFSTLIKIALSMALDQLRIAAEALADTHQLDISLLEKIAQLFRRIHSSPANEAEIAARGVIRLIGANLESPPPKIPHEIVEPEANHSELEQQHTEQVEAEQPAAEKTEQQEPESNPQIQLVHSAKKPAKKKDELVKRVETDLNFFKQMAERMDEQTPSQENRSDEILLFCLQVNPYLPKPLDIYQLTAAVYVHDVGMAFVAYKKDSKKEKHLDQKGIQKHPDFGFQMLKRMDGWEEAAEMVNQHHERVDGTGYPSGLKGDQICAGAKLIAVADRFYEVMNQDANETYRRSLLKAIKDINTNAKTVFDSTTVNAVNRMVREMITRKNG